jgi:hypothetical protein
MKLLFIQVLHAKGTWTGSVSADPEKALETLKSVEKECAKLKVPVSYLGTVPIPEEKQEH